MDVYEMESPAFGLKSLFLFYAPPAERLQIDGEETNRI